MARRPKQPCSFPGCPNLVEAGTGGRCEKHKRPSWEGRRGFEGYKGEYLKNRAVVLKDEPVCRICGIRPSTTVDHIIPKSKGGSDQRENLRGVCKSCHDKRSQRQAAEGRQYHRG